MRSPFQALLDCDKDASFVVYRSYNRFLPPFPLHLLELAAHGVPWILIPVMLFLFHPSLSASDSSLLLNLLAVSAIDLVLIAILKPLFRRSRPSYNRSIAPLSLHAVDQYSFPSGHATRAGLVAAFVPLALLLIQIPFTWHTSILTTCVFIWAIATSFSRVALGRHHILDVIVGFILGICYIAIWSRFWISAPVAQAFRDQLRSMYFGMNHLRAHALDKTISSTLSSTTRLLSSRFGWLCRNRLASPAAEAL